MDYKINIDPADVEAGLALEVREHIVKVAKKIAVDCILIARTESDVANYIADLGGVYHCGRIAKTIQEMIERELKNE